MPLIEDYAVIGNCEATALVDRNGSMDWLGLPRFDSDAFFCGLLGDSTIGRWLLSPSGEVRQTKRRYRGNSLVLQTTFTGDHGVATVIDFMSRRDGVSDVIRLVRGLRGTVQMSTEIVVRFGYGSIIPWVSRQPDGRLQFTAGPDRLLLDTSVRLCGQDMRTVGDFVINENEEIAFVLSWYPSYRPAPPRLEAAEVLNAVENFWSDWSGTFQRSGEWSDAVVRSLLTLKALTHRETGGIVAAATTSLPEKLGGQRNWDYRFCWLRDATFTLYALLSSGSHSEAKYWREWLLRAVAGNPADVQTVYGVAGERRFAETELRWIKGYQGSGPVRVGNAAAGQIQLDIYGEVIDALYVARCAGLAPKADSWSLECGLLEHLERIWNEPDNGIWEMRGPRRHFTHSKVMVWVAFDRAVRSVEQFGLSGPVERWRKARDAVHSQVCSSGFNSHRNSFVQSYGATTLDASLLLIPMVGFLPPSDRRVTSTLAAIEQCLVTDGLVMRYDTGNHSDQLPPGEGAFLACSFWLVDNFILQKRYDEARELFNRLLALRNDVGLLSEEYDVSAGRQVGNFPQAFSHLALINSAQNFLNGGGPAHHRSGAIQSQTGASAAF